MTTTIQEYHVQTSIPLGRGGNAGHLEITIWDPSVYGETPACFIRTPQNRLFQNRHGEDIMF